MQNNNQNQKTKNNEKEQINETQVNLLTRSIIAAVLFIVGFNFSYSSFFKDNPLYGINFLAETLISITSAFFGFYLVPRIFLQLKSWFESLIAKTISDIVGSFWDQQTYRINKKRREKQQKIADEEKKKLKEQIENSVVLDTSVLIDGRILDIVKTGFFDNSLVILPAVLNELHLISDSQNKLKRDRGRRGLDIVKKLKSFVKVVSPSVKTKESLVDNIILEFAKNNNLKLMTQDFNLNKLAQAQGIKVLNTNALVEAVKLSVLPGEVLPIEISHLGKEKNQGLGYMPDGTMVVVEDAREKVGSMVDTKVTRIIQSPAGKIIFAQLIIPEQQVIDRNTPKM